MSTTKRQAKIRNELQEKSYSRGMKGLESRLQNAVSSMSNAKWRKFFCALTPIEELFTGSNWKLVSDEKVRTEDSVPIKDDVLETHLVDGTFYWVCYKEIEWVDLLTESSDKVIAILNQTASFDICKIEGGIRVYGYHI